ncbi:hypothetical protein PY650_23950 [Rhizobium calliandrae]|uniref:HTH cro/C1-type domain-containing protein n=1 Tax=Rhizobium calliandrae TaxID=1312182 RepID=A0ABT7KJ39_9HYPH|nr:hypothetical protein [Rhizobium calliandrae]MDL2408643.1 hypothetical protein [Rhizobium calliandrae]
MDIRETFAKNLRDSALERCVYSPTIDIVDNLAKILGVKAADLLKEAGGD